MKDNDCYFKEINITVSIYLEIKINKPIYPILLNIFNSYCFWYRINLKWRNKCFYSCLLSIYLTYRLVLYRKILVDKKYRIYNKRRSYLNIFSCWYQNIKFNRFPFTLLGWFSNKLKLFFWNIYGRNVNLN